MSLRDMRTVFPACAGMNRVPQAPGEGRRGFPRMRGDEPSLIACFLSSVGVFPACAGMNPNTPRFQGLQIGFPRMRGDEPVNTTLQHYVKTFSPHARG